MNIKETITDILVVLGLGLFELCVFDSFVYQLFVVVCALLYNCVGCFVRRVV